MARSMTVGLMAAFGASVWLLSAAQTRAQNADDWSLTRPSKARPTTRTAPAPRRDAGRDLALALRALDRPAVIERLLADARAGEGGVSGLLREIESRAASAAQPQRWVLLLAQIQRSTGLVADARSSFERALSLQADALALRLFAAFEREQRELPQARELLTRALALPELRRGTAARCDAQLELGGLYVADAALTDARAQLDQARGECRERSAQILEQLLEVHRGLGTLSQFAAELNASSAPGAEQLAGRAFEELGQPAAAVSAYQRALASAPADLQLAERLIAILAREGRTAELIATYERLLRQPHGEPRFLSAATELLRELGRQEDAVALATRIGRARPTDVALHRLLVELYTRWELPDRARAELEWLTRVDPNESSHVLALADLELAQGRESQAAAVLRRLRRTAATPALGHIQLGQAYADHELPREALAEFDAVLSLAPQNLAAMRGRALALAKLFRHRDAEAEWQRLLSSPSADAERRRDAREQLVELWAEIGELERHVRDAEETFGYSAKSGQRRDDDGAPVLGRDPDIGRLLAEGYLRLARQPSYRSQPARYLRGAEDVLGQVVQLDPTDVASWRALERLRARRGDRDASIMALEQLVTLEPDRASEHLMRMAEYARAEYREQEAIAYAERAAAAAPQDAEIQEWLGDSFRARGDADRAMAAYQRALGLEPLRAAVALRLAELQAEHGETQAARQRLAAVLQFANDPELVLRAGRAALALASTPANLRELEGVLLRLIADDPRRSQHRRVLIEVYETLVPPLLARRDDEAQNALAAVRARAQKALLEALGDSDADLVQSAVRLLRSLATASAALPLATLAETDAPLALRRDALAAACAVGGAALAPRLLALSSAPEPALREVAAYCLARAPTAASGAALRKLFASETPAVRAFAALGLGKLGARDQPGTAPALRLTLAHDVSALVRSASAIAIGLWADRLTRASASAPETTVAQEDALLGRDALEHVVRGRDAALAASASLGLGFLGAPEAAPTLAAALFDPRASVADAAEAALRALRCDQQLDFTMSPPEPATTLDALLLDARTALDVCRSTSLALSFAEITEAARQALRGPAARRDVALAWLAGATATNASAESPPANPAPDPDAEFRSELLASLTSDLSVLASQRDPALRRALVYLFERTPVTAAEQALVGLVADPDREVRASALDALSRRKLPDRAAYADRLAEVARSDAAFGLRRRAVLVLGGMAGSSATHALLRALATDPFAVVRESAADALSGRDASVVGEALLFAMRTDAEPRVRLAAARSLRQIGGALLHTAREDSRLSPGVREILRAR